jgi:hypothetical protein
VCGLIVGCPLGHAKTRRREGRKGRREEERNVCCSLRREAIGELVSCSCGSGKRNLSREDAEARREEGKKGRSRNVCS